MGWVGDYYWTHGPLVLGSDALRRRWRAELPKRDAEKLQCSQTSFGSFETDQGAAWILPSGKHTTWIPIDSRSGFLVRLEKFLHDRFMDELIEILDPSWFEGPWRKVATLAITEELQLFDVVARAVATHEREGLERAHEPRCGDYFVLELDPGSYVVHRARACIAVGSREAELSVFRLVREGHTMPSLERVDLPSKPEPMEIGADVVELAESLQFVDTDGGPFVVIHESDLSRWYGVVDVDGNYVEDEGNADYWRACGSEYVAPLESGQGALVLSIAGPIAHAFHQTREGGIFIGWQGADTAAGCLGAVLAQPESAWHYRDFLWEVTGPAILMDANRDGRDFDRARWPRLDLEPGMYMVAELLGGEGGAHEFDGEVRHPDGRIEALMVTAIQLHGPMKDG